MGLVREGSEGRVAVGVGGADEEEEGAGGDQPDDPGAVRSGGRPRGPNAGPGDCEGGQRLPHGHPWQLQTKKIYVMQIKVEFHASF